VWSFELIRFTVHSSLVGASKFASDGCRNSFANAYRWPDGRSVRGWLTTPRASES